MKAFYEIPNIYFYKKLIVFQVQEVMVFVVSHHEYKIEYVESALSEKDKTEVSSPF